MAGLPSVAATFLSRVCIPFNAPFSKAKVSTTRCQGFAGAALSKSSEKRSSFFLAMDSAGTSDRSAANAAVVMSERAVKMRRVFIRCQVRAGCLIPVLPLASTSAACFSAQEAVCLDPAADCLYRSTHYATSSQHDSAGRFPARVFEGFLCAGGGRTAAGGSAQGAIARSQGTAHGLCGHLQFASPRYAADPGGPAAWQWPRHSPVSGESHHRGHDTERRP